MKRTAIIVAGALLLVAGPASATHKSWALIDSSAACRPMYPDPINDGWNGAYGNMTGDWQWVICPVPLAGLYGSTGSFSFPRAEWGLASHGEVYVYDSNASQDVQCEASVVTSTGSLLFSRTLTTSGTGMQTIKLLDTTNHTWGNSLAQSQVDVTEFTYRCAIPPPNPYISLITGFSVNICQHELCYDL